MSAEGDKEIREALLGLERLIAARVREEQLRHHLTRLPNQAALNEELKSRLQGEASFWVAFIEVDRFKSINDRFGYANADALLNQIATTVSAARSWFGEATAFHAHGDEFYLVGSATEVGSIEGSLNVLREAIRAIKVVARSLGEMTCTVSVGWLINSDVIATQTDRSILGALERAVGEAKRKRNCVLRYSSDFERDDAISLRADCGVCETKFSVDVKRSKNRHEEPFACPNCKADVDRPAAPEKPKGAELPTI